MTATHHIVETATVHGFVRYDARVKRCSVLRLLGREVKMRWFSLVSLCLVGCSGGAEGARFDWSFDGSSMQGFVVDQTDFDPATKGDVEVELAALGQPLTGRGLTITSFNRSDDQWVYAYRALGTEEGIVANTTYEATIYVDLATNIPSGCIGVGGSAEGIYLKGGVVGVEPGPMVEADGFIGFTADKGNQSEHGPEAVALGTLGSSGSDCVGDNPWELSPRDGVITGTADDAGNLWLYVGTDSAFEGGMTIAYAAIGVSLVAR